VIPNFETGLEARTILGFVVNSGRHNAFTDLVDILRSYPLFTKRAH
jgi:hypothetical protein